jgi:hypothetical protein
MYPIRKQVIFNAVGMFANSSVSRGIGCPRDGVRLSHEFEKPGSGAGLDKHLAVGMAEEKKVGGKRPFVG